MKRRSSALFLTGLVILVFCGIGAAYIRFYLGAKLAEEGLKELIQSGYGNKATISKTVIHWLGRPRIEYRGLSIWDGGEEAVWLRVRRVIVRPKMRSVFSKSFKWESLELEDPVVELSGEGGQFRPENLLSMLPQFDRFEIRSGRVSWNDREIQDFFVSLDHLSTSGPFPFVLRGALKLGNESPAAISARGLAQRLSDEWDLSDLKLSAEIRAKGVDFVCFGEQVARLVPPQLVGSKLTVVGSFDGVIRGRFKSSGTVTITDARFLEGMERLSADYTLSWDNQELEFQRIRLKTPSIPLEGRVLIRGHERENPVISFQVDCPWVSIERLERAFSFVPENVRSFLRSVKGGEMTLVSMGFTGPLESVGFPGNEESLRHWNGSIGFRNILIPWGRDNVEFKKGTVKIDGGRIFGEAVGLRLGRSDLQISHFSLSNPFSNPSIDMSLKGELNLSEIPGWISTGLVPKDLAIPLSRMELVSGKGDVNLRYEKSLGLSVPAAFAGRLALEDAAIRIRSLPGTFRRLNGVVEFSSAELSVRDVQGRWRNSSMRTSGSIVAPFSERPEIDLSVEGRLDLKNLGEMASWEGFPTDIRMVLREIPSPSGEGNYVMAIKGRPGSGENLDVSGELSVHEGSFHLWNGYLVKGVSGKILFSKGRILVPKLEGVWKNSDVALSTELIRSGTNFLTDLKFSGAFDLRDIASERFDHGLLRTWKRFFKPFDFQRGRAFVEVTHRKRNDENTVDGQITFEEATARYMPVFPSLTGMEGRVSFGGGGIKTIDVKGKYDSSFVKIQGDLATRSGDFEPFLSVRAEEVDFEKVLSWPWRKGFLSSRKTRSPLTVQVRIGRGRFRAIPFSDLEARLRLEEAVMNFEKVIFFSAEGQGLIMGWLRVGKDGEVSFEFRPYFIRLQTSPIVASLQSEGSKRALTGLGSARGVIRGSGNGVEEIARSLSGEIGFSLEEGKIGQSTVFSRVLSLVDSSYGEGGNSRDPGNEGIGYKTITGQVTLRNGTASTSDLLLDSDSMKISAVGDLEIPSGGLDLRLGLRRAGPGRKIVRAVPIFGEIVTGDGGSFIHYYLYVKGTIAEPAVEGIPYVSLSDGLSGLMRRLLEAPGKMVPFQRQPDLDKYFEQRKHPHP
ncbi:MAG: hypothetical protein GTN74_01400 [Proteobacteria bacterium]|nr:hypothetical protein [Pseudomonadota bacterium]NIS67768.1 hypothetical protein [Pseudomonadota bacterium]